MRLRFLFVAYSFLLAGIPPIFGTLTRDDTLKILQDTPFVVTYRVSDLPVADLKAAGVIPRGRTIESLIVNPGQDYQQHPTSVDLSKASSQLIFACIGEDYILCCFWTGGMTEAEHVILVRRAGQKSELLLHTVVWPEARDISAVRRFLKRNRWQPFDLREKNAFN